MHYVAIKKNFECKRKNVRVCCSPWNEKKEWVEKVKKSVAPDHDKLVSNYKKERAAKKFDASAKALEGREKRLRSIERPLERSPLVIPLRPEKGAAGKIVLKKVKFGYPAGFQGGPVTFTIPFGTRLAILGNNGVGKSTLLKTITQTLPPLSGSVGVGQALQFGYLMQEHENIARSITPLELFKKRLEIYDRDVVAKHLSQFQFPPDVITDKIASFSPGERVRLILALLSASGANVLVLDEPTNHLDLEAIESLEEALAVYPGTILLVTHDRRFLEKIKLTKNFILKDGKLKPTVSYTTYAKSVAPEVARTLKRFEEKYRT
jgi:ATPase subunit of ABC transporter with duplicated ATPase domains